MLKKYILYLSNPRWVSFIALFSFISLIALFSFGQLSFNDFWWHLAVGKWMFETKSLLTHDIFSLAFAGKEWLNNTWLFDGIMYQVYSVASYWGLGLLRLVIFSLTFFVFLKASETNGKKPLIISLAILILTIPLARNFLRPEIISPLFIGIFLYALYAHKYRASKFIYLLPIAEALWVNLHGGFTSGVILVGIFAASETIRAFIKHRNNIVGAFKRNSLLIRYWLVFFATAAATLINPYTYRIYNYYYRMLADVETLGSVSEWSPLSWGTFLGASLNGRLGFVLFGWIAVFLLIIKLCRTTLRSKTFFRAAERFGYEDLLIFLFFLLSAIQYVRGMHIFTLVSAFIIIKNIYHFTWLRAWIRPSAIAPILLYLAVIVLVLLPQKSNSINSGPSLQEQPRESINFVKNTKLPGNYINEYAAGSDLTWLLYPEYKVFMDGRAANVYDAQFYWYYRSMGNPGIFAQMIDKYDIAFAVASNSWTMTKILLDRDDWHLVFFDNAASIYVRDREDTKELIAQHEYKILHPAFSEEDIKSACTDPEKFSIVAAELNRNIRELDQPLFSLNQASQLILNCVPTEENLITAEHMASYAVSLAPDSTSHQYTLGLIQLKQGQDKAALKTFSEILKTQKDRRVMTGYAIAQYNLGKYRAAEKAFLKIHRLPGAYPNEYYQIYGRTLYQLDKNREAIDMLTRYHDLVGEENLTAQDYLDLALAYKDNNEPEKSLEYLEKTRAIDASIIPKSL